MKQKSRAVWVSLTIISLASIASCASDGEIASPRDFEGIWTVAEMPETAPAELAEATITIADGKISASTGCNEYFGTYHVDDSSQLRLGPGSAAEVACESLEIARAESILFASLSSARMDSGLLMLTTEYGDVSFSVTP